MKDRVAADRGGRGTLESSAQIASRVSKARDTADLSATLRAVPETGVSSSFLQEHLYSNSHQAGSKDAPQKKRRQGLRP